MKQHYKKPEMIVEELVLEGVLALSSDRIPVGDEVKPSATLGHPRPPASAAARGATCGARRIKKIKNVA